MQATLTQTLDALKSAKILTLVTRTQPKLLKKHRITKAPCPYAHGVERLAERSGMIGVCYDNSVNNQRQREQHPTDVFGDVRNFVPDQLWNGQGVHVEGSPFLVQHKTTGKLYLTFMPKNVEGAPALKADVWRDLADGRTLEESEVQDLANYLPPVSHSKTQETDKEIFWRTIGVDSVVQIRCGEIYDIVAA